MDNNMENIINLGGINARLNFMQYKCNKEHFQYKEGSTLMVKYYGCIVSIDSKKTMTEIKSMNKKEIFALKLHVREQLKVKNYQLIYSRSANLNVVDC